MPNEILEKSHNVKKEADSLIIDLGIHSSFSVLGEINFVGGYARDVMLKTYIDIHITTQALNPQKLLNVLDEFILNKNIYAAGIINTIDYIDFRIHNLPQDYNWPRGYYLNLRPVYNNREWNLDIWYYTDSGGDETISQTNQLQNELIKKPEYRNTIVKLKNEAMKNDHKSYITGLNGLKIYNAVIYENAQTIDDIIKG